VAIVQQNPHCSFLNLCSISSPNISKTFEDDTILLSSLQKKLLGNVGRSIIPDLVEDSFYMEYGIAAELLNQREFFSPLETLQELQRLPDKLFIVKIALARVAAAKPHSADVERLIGSLGKHTYT